MKKILLSAAALIAFTSASNAGMYISAGAGVNFNDSDIQNQISGAKETFKNAPFYSAAVGYDMPVAPVRAEIEGFYNKADAKHADTHMSTYGLMANAYLRIPVVGIYGGAGVGYGSIANKKSYLAQGMVGVEYGIFGIHAGLEYKHMQSIGDIKQPKYDAEADYKADIILAKVRIGF